VVEAALDSCNVATFVDASKDPTRARYLIKTSGLDVRVIHLVRDSLAFVNSDQRHRKRTLGASIRMWKRCSDHVERLRATLPEDRFLRVRYEDLCQDLESELRRITDFAGVSPFALPVRFRQHEHHVIGNRARKSDEERIVLDERWRSDLSSEAAAEIRRRTESQRRMYRYV
jgi:hypothetical protein